MKLSGFKTSTYFVFFSILLFVIINFAFLIVVNYFLKEEALEEAKEKADLILDKNLSIHDYFTYNLKPDLFKTLKSSVSNKYYFDPLWMSSSHAIMRLEKYFSKRNSYGYYYKDAAINARSIDNEADSVEREYLIAINKNPDTPTLDGIRSYQGKEHYFVMKKGETMYKSCLRCHTLPEFAPGELVKIYGDKKSFNRKQDEISSIVSIRIPIDQAYSRANNLLLLMILIMLILTGIAIFVFAIINRNIVIKPLEILTAKTNQILNDSTALGKKIDLSRTKELNELINSFNTMSIKLYNHQLSLEEKIKDKTQHLEDSIREIKQLNDQKQKIFSIIAHDLRSPFSPILGFSKLLKRNCYKYDTDKIIEFSEAIYQKSYQLFNLLENLLEWSKNKSGKTILKLEMVSCNALIFDIYKLMLETAEQKNINLSTDLQTDVMINVDVQMTKTILRNLISNALKFTYPLGRIKIRTNVKKENVEISISDTGTGIAKDDIDQLFIPYKLSSKPGTANENGTGLGLMLCKEFVEKQGGKLWLQSKIGEGSTFTFTVKKINVE